MLPDPVEDLMARCLGEPDPSSAITEACRLHPDHAPLLRQRYAALLRMGIVGTTTTPAPSPSFPSRLGEFRLIQELGHGGMGVVYLAEQESLHREVALKLIRPEQLYFPNIRERFKREVEAVARMQHPSIVPVYTVGEADGIPYYAMQRLDGCTLAEVLARLHPRAPESLAASDLTHAAEGTWVRACLLVIRQIADALAHAHAKGILHRDVKPSNIAITATGAAMLFDFGLSSDGRIEPATAKLTRTGARLGSLLYMSPEQLSGRLDAVDQRTDLYALGVTLYELLTLQVPYRGDSTTDVERLILDGQPDSIRARNRKVPADVVTVCLTAMERDPARRYQTAGALLEDLDNLLQLRPIRARPPGALVRLHRWTQRNPGRATALAMSLVLIAGVPSVLLWQQSRHNRQLQDSLDKEKQALAKEQRARASEQRAQLAAHRVRDFLIGLFRTADPDETHGEDVPASKLLARGVEKIATELQAEPLVRAELLGIMSDTYRGIGQTREAVRLQREALTALQENGAHPNQVLTARHRLGLALERAGELQEAETLFAELLAEFAAGGWPAAHELASLEHSLGRVLVARHREREAEPHLREALRRYADDPAADPKDVAFARLSLGSALAQLDRGAESEQLLREALAWLEANLGPERYAVATCHQNLALLLARQQRFAEAESSLRHAITIYTKLYGEACEGTVVAWANVAAIRANRNDSARALVAARKSVELARRALAPEVSARLHAETQLGGLLHDAGGHREAVTVFDEILPVLERVLPASDRTVRVALTKSGRSRLQLGQAEAAEALLRRAHEASRGLETDDVSRIAVECLADVLDARGQQPAAVALLEEWLAIRVPLPAVDPDLMQTFYFHARRLRALEQDAEAVLTRAIAYGREHAPSHWLLFGCVNELADLQRQRQRFAEAERLLLENEAAARGALQPQDVMHAAIHRRLADLYDAMAKPEEARRWRQGAASRPSSHPR